MTTGTSVVSGSAETSSGTRTSGTAAQPRERADLLETLAHARHYLRYTARDLTDDQARQRTTASELTVGGLLKHVTAVERNWAAFIVHGPSVAPDFTNMTEADFQAWADGFRLLPGETLAGALAAYEEVARHTDELVATLPDLDAEHPLPPAPWNKPGERWSARRVLLHIAAETAQHAGHADIIRESLDGAKSMG
ncbi:MAG TPA: DinB family protein [Trebonia sp.]|nr:DinB family protein [Trebonia sp.]